MNQQQNYSFTIISQPETARPGATGGIQRGHLVTFETSWGEQATVFVADANYNAGYVRSAILDKIARMDAIRNLTG